MSAQAVYGWLSSMTCLLPCCRAAVLRKSYGNKEGGGVLGLQMTTPSLGRYGAYLLVQDYETRSLASRVKGLEDSGYGTVWIAGNVLGDLTIPESFLAETESIAVGTAIVNVCRRMPTTWRNPSTE